MVQKLLEGFQAFRRDGYEGHAPIMKRLVEQGQSPDYFIISCIDSRSDPGTIFRPEPGTFFAHKAMGAIVRPYKKGTALSAALQFALEHSKVREIIILGHTGCGAIKALVENIPDDEISSFVEVASAGLEKAQAKCHQSCTHDDLFRHTEEHIILESAENLKTYPCVAKALSENRVTIRPWLFDMERGDIFEYNDDTQEFTPLIFDEENKEKYGMREKNA